MNKLNVKNTTFVSGLWLIDGNQKRDFNHYFEYLPATLKHIAGGQLLFFYERQQVLEKVKEIATALNIEIRPVKLNIDDLPYSHCSLQALQACQNMNLDYVERLKFPLKDKGSKHYRREYSKSGPDAYQQILSLWFSKIRLVSEIAIKENHFQTDYFAWIDASFGRFDNKRHGWKLEDCEFDTDRLNHYSSNMYYKDQKLPLNASFLYTNVEIWQKLDFLFDQKLQGALQENYAHDEETILGLVHSEHPELFFDFTARKRGFLKRLLGL